MSSLHTEHLDNIIAYCESTTFTVRRPASAAEPAAGLIPYKLVCCLLELSVTGFAVGLVAARGAASYHRGPTCTPGS